MGEDGEELFVSYGLMYEKDFILHQLYSEVNMSS